MGPLDHQHRHLVLLLDGEPVQCTPRINEWLLHDLLIKIRHHMYINLVPVRIYSIIVDSDSQCENMINFVLINAEHIDPGT
jgi:hypothetical protein